MHRYFKLLGKNEFDAEAVLADLEIQENSPAATADIKAFEKHFGQSCVELTKEEYEALRED